MIAQDLKLPEQEVFVESQWLKNEGLLEFVAMGGELGITHQGIKEVEAMRMEPDEGTDYFPPLSQVINVFHGPVGVAQSGSGSIQIRDSVLNVLAQVKDDHALEFKQAVRDLLDGIQNSDHLHPDKKQAAFELTNSLVEEAAREKPHRRKVVAIAICCALAAILGTAVDLADVWDRVEPIISGFFE
jgi:hypothetical protein